MFEIPICLFVFLREETTFKILERIKLVKPKTFYIFSDQGRNEEEKKLVFNLRKKIDSFIDWECNCIKIYRDHNVGVYEQIALGAKYVFENEKYAIFLEDDNLPEESFFEYCKQCLYVYENNDDILWICGTNYLKKYNPKNGSDILFTQHMLPCGWASWSNKFLRYYDFDFDNLDSNFSWNSFRKKFSSRKLFSFRSKTIKEEYQRKINKIKYCSWDFHMVFSLRFHNKLGVVPKYNQIKNIGVDDFSIHGGNSLSNIMTRRYCLNPTYKLNFPLNLPKEITIDKNFEKKMENIIVPPLWYRLKRHIHNFLLRIKRIIKKK